MHAPTSLWVAMCCIGAAACSVAEVTPVSKADILDVGLPMAETTTPLPSIDEAPRFQLYSQEPVLQPGSGWDRAYTVPGAATAYGGLLHMFYSGSDTMERVDPLKSIGYAISLDGIQWHRFSGEPLKIEGGMANDLGYIDFSSVLQDENGEWMMYFSATWAESSPSGRTFIARATAHRLEGPWIVDETPVLEPGNASRWDGGGITDPQVIRTDQGYRMYFSGVDADVRQFGPAYVGMATSEDGITWTKHDDPGTTSRLFQDSDPVFKTGGEGNWDATFITNPQIKRTEQGWMMLYRGINRERFATTAGFGFASSEDGITWERDPRNPILDSDEFLEGHAIWQAVWLFFEDRHYLYLAGYHLSFEVVDVFLAIGN